MKKKFVLLFLLVPVIALAEKHVFDKTLEIRHEATIAMHPFLKNTERTFKVGEMVHFRKEWTTWFGFIV